MSIQYDKEFEDTEGNLLRIYSTIDEQDVNRRVIVHVISDVLIKELVLDKATGIGLINALLAAMGSGTKIKYY